MGDRLPAILASLAFGEELDERERAAIVAAGARVVPTLIEVLNDEALAREDAEGGGYAPLHAARLLAAIGANEAIAPLIARLTTTHADDALHDQIVVALPSFGAQIVEPLLALHDDAEDDDLRDSCCDALAHCGTRDERIRSVLFQQYERFPALATALLGSYGDPAGVPFVERSVARWSEPEDRMALAMLRDAVEALSSLGAATDEHQALVERASERVLAETDARGRPLPPLRIGTGLASGMTPARRRGRPGRNEPCWCGSGKKYKRCHADEDDRGERAELDETQARAAEDDLAAMLLAIGEEELAIFGEGEEDARENMARLVALAWNIDSYTQRRDHDSAEALRAELDGDADEEELHALVEELIERKQEACPGDTRIVASVSIVDGALFVRGA